MARRLPVGISQTSKGWRISVRTKGRPLWQKRFPPSKTLEDVEKELATARALQRAKPGSPESGTLAGDAKRYLENYFKSRPGYAERERHLQLWIAALGATAVRRSITREDVSRTLEHWKASGLAADTCNKRRSALLALFNALDGRGGVNPVREVAKFRSPDPLPRGIAYPLIRKALKQLPRCKTRARLAVIAYTGIRHGQLMRLTPDDWDDKAQTLQVPGTAKGRGTKPYVVPLSEAATKALTELDALDGWGPFTWAPMARMWKAAATAAELPDGTRPYDLRHSFGTEIFLKTGDLKTTKELLGQASIRMTERYMLAAVPRRQSAAIAKAFPPTKKHRAKK